MTGRSFTSFEAASIAGISYRQLDYWARTDLVVPSGNHARGSGSRRRYSMDDLLELAVIRALLDNGIALPVVREIAAGLEGLEGTDRTYLLAGQRVIPLPAGGDGWQQLLEETLRASAGVASVLSVAAVRADLEDRIQSREDAVRRTA